MVDRNDEIIKDVIILVSIQAIERIRKDKFVKENKKRYNAAVLLIIKTLKSEEGNKQIERIGYFNISPRGHSKIRIAWHYCIDKDGKIFLYIDDLLYHITDKNYIGNWNEKAAKKEIMLKNYGDYQQRNFPPF